jgi:hypothetical protein
LAHHASYDKSDNAVPLLIDNATAKSMVKLMQLITAKNALNESMPTKPGAAIQEYQNNVY